MPGQTPVSAVFVCSSETFSITTPSHCGQTTVPTPCTDGGLYQNKNPNFFRFACYVAGTLGFTIVPDDMFADYNWQVFDVTSTNPVDIFTNPNLFVACNWSAVPGETGATAAGSNTMVCGGGSQPTYTKMPSLLVGHTYLLMVSNESASPSGYQLTFTGGTAIITDAIDPHLSSASLSCDRTSILVRLNKLVKCNSLSADGSDFSITGGVNIVSATPTDCSNQFGTPSLTLTLDQPLGFGTFTLTINDGADGNTLLDICGRTVPGGETLPVVSSPQQFTPMDSVYNVSCKPGYIELVFKKPILCNSIAGDGSDFIISGPQVVTASPAPTCNSSGTTNIIRLNLSGSITPGTYQVRLVSGTDGNTLLNDCLVPTPANSTVSFNVAQSVSAVFTQDNNGSCSQNTVSFFHNGANNVSTWNWNFGNGINSALANPVISFTKGSYNVRLIVSNGTCSDTSNQTIVISDEFRAAFLAPPMVCPGDLLQLDDNSTGNIDTWAWDFGNGMISNLRKPSPFFYSDTGNDAFFTVRLIVGNNALGCKDTATRVIRKLKNCLIAVPNAFSPNGDGKNDFLYPLNALKADNLEFKVYNRTGQLVFATKDWTKKWNGRVNGLLQDTGVFAWILSYTDHDTGNKILKKGTTLLLR